MPEDDGEVGVSALGVTPKPEEDNIKDEMNRKSEKRETESEVDKLRRDLEEMKSRVTIAENIIR